MQQHQNFVCPVQQFDVAGCKERCILQGLVAVLLILWMGETVNIHYLELMKDKQV